MPEQSYLLPPSPMDWLPEGHLAYFVLELGSSMSLGSRRRSRAGASKHKAMSYRRMKQEEQRLTPAHPATTESGCIGARRSCLGSS